MPDITAGDIKSSTSADELGVGFTPAQLNQLGLLSLVTAKDFYRIDDLRLAKYSAAGVSSPLLQQLHHEAGEALKIASDSQNSLIAGGGSPGLPNVNEPGLPPPATKESATQPVSNAASTLNAADAAWAGETRVTPRRRIWPTMSFARRSSCCCCACRSRS